MNLTHTHTHTHAIYLWQLCAKTLLLARTAGFQNDFGFIIVGKSRSEAWHSGQTLDMQKWASFWSPLANLL